MNEVIVAPRPHTEFINATTAIVAKCVFDCTDAESARTLAARYIRAELDVYKKRWGSDGYKAMFRQRLLERIETRGDLAIVVDYLHAVRRDLLMNNTSNHEPPVQRGIAISFDNLASSLIQ
ncbi:MAG: hypothetical protein PHQ59_00955 [Candidatus Daviesbacteria bacterium]|nr:hypothetical protein [Candidatus Daviesbacteria bacterium]